jgi:site-specific DNA-methyltransferase (adenine-specific)
MSVTPYYQDEAVCIYHGDAREVLPFLPKTDLLLTDPPYGAGYAARPIREHEKVKPTAMGWDDSLVSPWVFDWLRERTGHQIIWGGNYYPFAPTRCWLVWHKPDAAPSMADLEMAWTNLDRPSQHITYAITAAHRERCGHPTQKPEAVMRWALMQAPEGCNVLDPFMGSGTTLVAAKRLGRKAIGIERERKYCDLAVERLSQGALGLELGSSASSVEVA